jgi:molybdopterin-guanine dinucleotide biosynthesis protein A
MGELGAILLAGGRGSRMGGVHKPLLDVGGTTLLDAALGAARDAGCEPIVVVGPADEAHAELTWVREDPPFGGPAAAILAGLPLMTAPRVLVLACDLPHAGDVVRVLRSAAQADDAADDGVCLEDASGRRQWLAGVYRGEALRHAAASLPDAGRDASVRGLLGGLAIRTVTASDALAADIDTWDDLQEARQHHARQNQSRRNPRSGPRPTRRTQEEHMSERLPPEALDEWADELRRLFGLGPDDIPIPLILDLARDVAVGVARPAAPLSAFVAGLVAGRAGGTPEQVRRSVAEITSLANGYHEDD